MTYLNKELKDQFQQIQRQSRMRCSAANLHDCDGEMLHGGQRQRFHLVALVIRSSQETRRVHDLTELRESVLSGHDFI
jgi:ABC-type hemin transport system ATPase subunit